MAPMGTRRCLVYSCYLSAAVTLLILIQAPGGAAQPLPWQLCDETAGSFTEGSAYQANIRALAGAIPRNASSSPALFAKGAAGAGPDAVYALALCRGDTTNASSCEACVATAFRDAQQLCAYSRGATMFDDPCILRYSNLNFLPNVTDNRWKIGAFNANNVSAGAAAAFDAASGRLVNATAEFAAADPARRFGTGEVGFDDQTYPKIYALAQCTPDMAASDCRSCLGDITTQYTAEYFVGKPGGRVFGVRCNFRFEASSFFSGSPLLQLPSGPSPAPAPSPTPAGEGRTKSSTGLILAITLPVTAAVLLIVAYFCFWRRRGPAERKPSVPFDSTTPDDIQSIDSLLLDLSTLRAATDNFAESNKLGEGGFGTVYKGVLSGGHEIAVKRLSQSSRQGIDELKTELVLVAKLQHQNLVRLVGVCLEQDEKLLVYEYMPNRSLDTLLFDSEKSRSLDWGKRLRIVSGVARGLQYLHEDSQLRIVHRDLKASNVLLDSDCNPKISDFGLAKLFEFDQSQAVTSRIAGTYGYMAPEYAMRGQYSVKSDAFSFGVLLLEIVTGRRNSCGFGSSDSEQSVDLLSLVWEHWATGTIEELVDGRSLAGGEMLRLVNVGLLCVQDNPADRPAMSAVNVMLSSSTVSLQAPSKPTFCIDAMEGFSDMYTEGNSRGSQPTTGDGRPVVVKSPNDQMSLTEVEAR